MTYEVFLTVVISLEMSNIVDSVGSEGNFLSYIFNVFHSEKKPRFLFTRKQHHFRSSIQLFEIGSRRKNAENQ